MGKDAGDLHLHTYPLPRKQQPGYASMTRGVRAVVRAGEPIVTFSARVDLHTPPAQTDQRKRHGQVEATRGRVPAAVAAEGALERVRRRRADLNLRRRHLRKTTRFVSKQSQRCLVALRSSRRASP